VSEKKGSFEAALDHLGFYLDPSNLKAHIEKAILTSREERRTQIQAAIRVLEAAGKVDRSKALDGMEAMRAMMSRELFMNTGLTFQAIYTLLEALPEEA